MAIAIFFLYFISLIVLSFIFSKRQTSDKQFVLGNRSLSFYLTALSAHASDMSSWLFLAYPAMIYKEGPLYAFAALGLIFFMYLNWQYIAPKLREVTGKCNNLTLSGYFESRFNDKKGTLRITASILAIFFYIPYVSAGLISLGLLVENLVSIQYLFAIIIGLGIVAFYVFLGGYKTVAWIDLLQGLFLLFVILFVPLMLVMQVSGFEKITTSIQERALDGSFHHSFSYLLMIFLGWGLGYFGQPHILTKFMGIAHVNEMSKAKYLGITWQTLSLFGATLLGLLGILFFKNTLPNIELMTIEMVQKNLSPFFSGLILCSILAATTNVIAAQILVVASTLGEDLYQKFISKDVSHKKLLTIVRSSVLIIAIISFAIAAFQPTTIFNLVLYAWSGLGASFGPVVIFSLWKKNITKTAALCGMLTGGFLSATLPLFFPSFPPLVPSFILSMLVMLIISKSNKKISQLKDS